MMEFQGEDHLDTLVIMLGTNDVSSAPVTPDGKWEHLLVCLLNELKEKYRPRLVVLCTIPQNPEMSTPVADFMNGNVTRWNEMTRGLLRTNPSELRLMDLEKYLIVASSDYLYTPRSLFWPDVIFLTVPKLDWGESAGMMISVRMVVSMELQVIVVAGSNDHLQSRGLLSRLTDGSIPSNEVIGEAIMTLLSAMAEVETSVKQRFTQNVVKVVFVLSPGYATLPEHLQFVYTMFTTIAEFSVILPAPNRTVDPNNYYPYRSELPTIWADISNAIQGFKDCSTTRLVLDEVLGLELSNCARLLKLRPGVDDDHLLVQQVANDL